MPANGGRITKAQPAEWCVARLAPLIGLGKEGLYLKAPLWLIAIKSTKTHSERFMSKSWRSGSLTSTA